MPGIGGTGELGGHDLTRPLGSRSVAGFFNFANKGPPYKEESGTGLHLYRLEKTKYSLMPTPQFLSLGVETLYWAGSNVA